MTTFHEGMRYEYPLNESSVVIDLGCYNGQFTKAIAERYHCKVFAFEPVNEFHRLCSETLKGIPNVFLSQTAVGGFPRMQAIHVQNDSSGLYGTSEKTEEVWVSPLTDVLKAIGLDHVDLIKINIEGSEFEVLEHVLEHGLEPKLRNIQVQFHPVVPNSAMRYDNIRKGLLKTHRETWNCPWIWENYELL